MEIKQAVCFGYSLDGGRIPLAKNALYTKQVADQTHDARYIWTDRPSECMRPRFRLSGMNADTGEVYHFLVDAKADAIGRAFSRFAASLPKDRLIAIPRVTKAECNHIGPHDRKPQQYELRAISRERSDGLTDVSVTVGCRIGKQTFHTEEAYNSMWLHA